MASKNSRWTIDSYEDEFCTEGGDPNGPRDNTQLEREFVVLRDDWILKLIVWQACEATSDNAATSGPRWTVGFENDSELLDGHAETWEQGCEASIRAAAGLLRARADEIERQAVNITLPRGLRPHVPLLYPPAETAESRDQRIAFLEARLERDRAELEELRASEAP